MMNKTTLGILGLGSRTTAYYITELNRLYNQTKGGFSSCPFILLNTNFDTINSLLPNPSEDLDNVTQLCINEVEKLNTDCILVPNITLHETIDNLVLDKHIIHPIPLTTSKIKEKNWSKITLFGSIHSMQSAYISSYFKSNGIETILPSEGDRFLIDDVRKRVYAGTETEELIKSYHLLIEKYAAKHPVVLGCTELSILKPINNQNLVDMAEVQITEAVQRVLQNIP